MKTKLITLIMVLFIAINTSCVQVNSRQSQNVKSLPYLVYSKIIGTSRYTTSIKIADDEAYKNALEQLKNMKLNDAYLTEIKRVNANKYDFGWKYNSAILYEVRKLKEIIIQPIQTTTIQTEPIPVN